MSKRRVLPLYFGKREDDLWEAIQAIPEGDRNHEVRLALRKHFMKEQIPEIQSEKETKKTDLDKVNLGLNSGLIK